MSKTLLKKNGYTLFEYPQFIGTDVPAYSIRYEFEDFSTTIYQGDDKNEAIRWFEILSAE